MSPTLVVLWLIPLVVALLGSVAVALRWAGRAPGRWGLVGGALAAVAAIAAAAAAFDPTRVPTHLVTLLHEGTGVSNLMRVGGDALHAGPVFHALAEVSGVYRLGDVRPLVVVGFATLLAQGVVGAAVARVVLGRWAPALLWGGLLVLAPSGIHGGLSETPGPLLGLLTWLAVLPHAVLAPERGLRDRDNVLALLTLAALGVSAVGTRVEFVVLALPAFVAAVARLRRGDAELDARTSALVARGWAWLRRAALRPAFPWVVLGVTVALHLVRSLGGYELGTAVWMANPVAPEVTGPLVHALTYLPTSAVVLAVAGAVHLLRAPWRSGLVTLGAMALLRGYRSGSNGVHLELFRYMGMASPLLLLLALFGWREIVRWTDRLAAPDVARRLAFTALVLGFVSPPPTGLQDLVAVDFRDTPVRDGFPLLLSGVPQAEARMALEARRRWPACVLVSRVTTDTHGSERAGSWSWVVLGQGRVRVLGGDGVDLATLVDREAPRDACVLFLAGQDCNLVASTDHCEAERAAGPALLEQVVVHGQTTEPSEFGFVLGEARLAVHAVRGP